MLEWSVSAPKIRSLCPLLDQNASIHKHMTKLAFVIWSSELGSLCICGCWLCYPAAYTLVILGKGWKNNMTGKDSQKRLVSQKHFCVLILADCGHLTEWHLEKKKANEEAGNRFCQSRCGTVVSHCSSCHLQLFFFF